jgi:hypothetical protein
MPFSSAKVLLEKVVCHAANSDGKKGIVLAIGSGDFRARRLHLG